MQTDVTRSSLSDSPAALSAGDCWQLTMHALAHRFGVGLPDAASAPEHGITLSDRQIFATLAERITHQAIDEMGMPEHAIEQRMLAVLRLAVDLRGDN